jgi:hypothetical protein
MDLTDHPFWNVMWSFFLIWIWVAWFWFLIQVIADVFRRRDLSGPAKATWSIFVLIVPLIGALTYMITQGDKMADRHARNG